VLLEFSGAETFYEEQGNIFLKVLKQQGKRIPVK